MATSGPAHRNVSNIRPTVTAAPGSPSSPHTPLRTISSTFGSPSTLRAEEECVVLELGSRYLRAGFAGDALPKAVTDFGPEQQKRAGDYRKWDLGFEPDWRKRVKGTGWGEQHELWKLDLRGVDLGLVGDKIERGVREAFTKYLLIDSRPRKMTLALPSTLPTPLLSTILDTVFTHFQPPTISLMSAPALATVAAGLRASLVVDIGWAETVVTCIYEFREVQCKRSIRATKFLGQEMQRVLLEVAGSTIQHEGYGSHEILSFEECEEVATRLAWCKSGKKPELVTSPHGLPPVKEEDELRSSMRALDVSGDGDADPTILVPLSSTNPPTTLRLPFSKLAEPCETALFAAGTSFKDLDDEELPIHVLIYRSLLQLPVDLRSICMSRIVFIGGGSKILGLKARVLDEVATLIDQRGWDPVQGRAVAQFRLNPKLKHNQPRPAAIGPTEVLQGDEESGPKIRAALQDQEYDAIADVYRREASKGTMPIEKGYLRAVESLGVWSGASLLSQLKIPAVSVVERESWLQHGAAGASKAGEIDISVGRQRQSMGPGAFKSGAVERSSWTLGLWG